MTCAACQLDDIDGLAGLGGLGATQVRIADLAVLSDEDQDRALASMSPDQLMRLFGEAATIAQRGGGLGELDSWLSGVLGKVGKAVGKIAPMVGAASPFLSMIPGIGPALSAVVGGASSLFSSPGKVQASQTHLQQAMQTNPLLQQLLNPLILSKLQQPAAGSSSSIIDAMFLSRLLRPPAPTAPPPQQQKSSSNNMMMMMMFGLAAMLMIGGRR